VGPLSILFYKVAEPYPQDGAIFKNKKAEGASPPTLSERGAGTQSRMKIVKTSALKLFFFHLLDGIPF
jgi:hypothetical protein